jgi:hypothetical protein
LPRSISIAYLPGGKSMRKGCAETVVCRSIDSGIGTHCSWYAMTEPSVAALATNDHSPCSFCK